MSLFALTLLPASWRGIPFGVDANIAAAGRRLAVHQYPYRDTVWPEDLGKGPRRHMVQGFIVGDDVAGHRAALLAAAEQQGPGVLVHPTLGVMTLTLVTFSTSERREEGRLIELSFEFIEAGTIQFPTIGSATGPLVVLAGAQAAIAVAANYAAVAGGLLSAGISVVAAIAGVATAFGSFARRLSGDAASAFSATAGLQGNNGRYSAGNRALLAPQTSTVASVLADQAVAQAAVVTAASELPAAVGGNPETDLPPAVQAVTAAYLGTAADPAEQIRSSIALAAFVYPAPINGAGLQGKLHAAAIQTTALCTRYAAIALAQAAAAFLPGSYDEAVAIRAQVTGALDAEITLAGDLGDDEAYLALRALRTAVADDLSTRATGLPHLKSMHMPTPLPGLLIAQLLYRDGTRVDDLIVRVDPPHPAFFPTDFLVLAA